MVKALRRVDLEVFYVISEIGQSFMINVWLDKGSSQSVWTLVL